MNPRSGAAKNTVSGMVLASLSLASPAIAAPAGEAYPADVQYQAAASQSGAKRRMQVRTEAALARVQGEASGGEGGYAIAAPAVGEPTRPAGAGRTRAAVVGALRQAASDGTLVKTGEAGQLSETHPDGTPRSRAAVRPEGIDSAGNGYAASVARGQ